MGNRRAIQTAEDEDALLQEITVRAEIVNGRPAGSFPALSGTISGHEKPRVTGLFCGTKRGISNPFVRNKNLLIRLNKLCNELLRKALHAPLRPRPRPAWPRRSPVLETVTRLLAQ